MNPGPPPMDNLSLIAGRVCLDFANTVGWRGTDTPHDRIAEYRDLVRWSLHARLVDAPAAARLVAAAARDPRSARRALEDAVELRESVFRIFSGVAGGHAWEDGDLAVVNRELARAMAEARIGASPHGGFVREWSGSDRADRVIWPVAHDAAELLLSPEDLARVRRCADERCGWLFMDRTRNRSRRWCDMRDCGNVAKAQRHRARTRGGGV